MSFLKRLGSKDKPPTRELGTSAKSSRSSTTGRSPKDSKRPSSSPAARPRADTDPETCLEVFQSHWNQAWLLINQLGTGMGTPTVKRTASEESETITRYIDQMLLLLMEEQDQDGGQGPILQYVLMEDILEKILTWALTSQTPEQSDKLKLHQLKMYDNLISQSQQQMLIHKPVIRPLLKLLAACEEHSNPQIEKHLMLVLSQLSVCLTYMTELLELLFDASSDQGPARFLMFSILIPYTHREGTIGQQARDALLLIMALSAKHNHIGKHIAEQSNFCPVLATGLSGLYSSLPRKLSLPSDDWFQLTEADVQDMPQLSMFLNSLEFCNAVVQVAHSLVKEQLLSFIYHGFLVPVMGPALHQDIFKLPLSLVESYFGSSMDEVIAATAYLELFIRRITEPAMMRTFLRFVLTEKCDDMLILHSLIMRINSTSRLCMVSLSLFLTLVDLNCEDVMFELVFRYLLPCSHVMVSQRRSVKDLDLYGKTAEKFLSLKPACCVSDASETPPEGDGTPVSAESLSAASSSPPSPLPEASRFMPFRRTFSFRNKGRVAERRSSAAEGSSSPEAYSPPLASASLQCTKLVHFETSYLEYLASVQERLRQCQEGCKCWSAPYDGENPPADSIVSSPRAVLDILPPVKKLTGVTPVVITDLVVNGDTETSKATGNETKAEDGERQQKEPVSESNPSNSSEDPAAEVHVDGETKLVQPLDNLESVPSDTDSGLSGSSVTNQSSASFSSRTDSPLNDNFDSVDFNSFLLSLKRVKTPVEFCDNAEESFSEIDSIISDLKSWTLAATQASSSDAKAKPQTGKTEENGRLEPSDLIGAPSKGITLIPTTNSQEENVAVGLTSQTSATDSGLGLSAAVGQKQCPSSAMPLTPTKILGSPDIGPFLQTLLSKLESMMSNTLYVNLLLTAVIARLAYYPQPLLRSFLLNPSLVFQPTVKSLVQVLGSVKHRVDCHSYTIKEFDVFLLEARRYLAWREEVYLTACLGSTRGRSDSTVSLPPNLLSNRSATGIEQAREKKKGPLGEFFFGRNRLTASGRGRPPSSRLQMIDGKTMHYVNRTASPLPAPKPNDLEIIRTKNAVYCAVVLEEFLKELAAISQEHGVLNG